MSTDRFTNEKEQHGHARCRRSNIKSFCGDFREPFFPDEHDAVLVVDIRFPEDRLARYKFIPDGPEWFRVEALPTP